MLKIEKIRAIIKEQKGYSLVELLAIIVILGIVSSIAVVTIGNIIVKAKVNSVLSNGMQIMETAKLAVMDGDKEVVGEEFETTGKIMVKSLDEYFDLNQIVYDGKKGTFSSDTYVKVDGKTFTLHGTATVNDIVITFKGATIQGLSGDVSTVYNGYFTIEGSEIRKTQ